MTDAPNGAAPAEEAPNVKTIEVRGQELGAAALAILEKMVAGELRPVLRVRGFTANGQEPWNIANASVLEIDVVTVANVKPEGE